MKVIILSAGQGKRLLPLTARVPKCLLEIRGKSILEWQIGELHKCGVDQVTVVTGYGSEKVDDLLNRSSRRQNIKTFYNPDYATTDNLVSCWKVRDEMTHHFVLLNGDTLFEAAVFKKLLASPVNAVTVTINHKDKYDADDMKVSLSDTRLIKIGKDIPADRIHGESIGMILFRGDGPMIFRAGMEKALSDHNYVRRWYLSVIDAIAMEKTVLTCAIEDLRWCEVDYPSDLQKAEAVVSCFSSANVFDAVKRKYKGLETAVR